MQIWQNEVSGTRKPRMGNTRTDKGGLQTRSKDKEVINTQDTNTASRLLDRKKHMYSMGRLRQEPASCILPQIWPWLVIINKVLLKHSYSQWSMHF